MTEQINSPPIEILGLGPISVLAYRPIRWMSHVAAHQYCTISITPSYGVMTTNLNAANHTGSLLLYYE